MNKARLQIEPSVIPLGLGSYTAAEAAALVGVPVRNVNRWLRGYAFRQGGTDRQMPPLWSSQHATIDDHLELGFRDLVELRFVAAFGEAGVGLLAIRNCLEYARGLVEDERPFSTRRFKTDGRTIFLQSLDRSAEGRLLDLKNRHYVFSQVIERTFKDLDIDDDVVVRWRPYKGKTSIVIDPERAFGQPIAAEAGVPVVALADAVEAEGSIDRVSRLFDVPPAVVRDAVTYHATLQKAA
jgi:uncharacterized protein (DUF433 family)